MQARSPLKTAWLVTWEWSGDHARVEEEKRIVAVLNYRWTGERVRFLVEHLYLSFGQSVWEMVAVARNKRGNTYPAEFDTINGVRWQGSIRCGHNPSLHARLVHNLRVVVHDDGSLKTTWDERPRPPNSDEA
jgi:hypothetical protein